MDSPYACKTIESVVTIHRGRVDQLVPSMIEQLVKKMILKSTQDVPDAILFMLDALGAIAHYNPLLFVTVLEQTRQLKQIFNMWLTYLPEMKG